MSDDRAAPPEFTWQCLVRPNALFEALATGGDFEREGDTWVFIRTRTGARYAVTADPAAPFVALVSELLTLGNRIAAVRLSRQSRWRTWPLSQCSIPTLIKALIKR